MTPPLPAQVTPSLAFHFMFYATLKDALETMPTGGQDKQQQQQRQQQNGHYSAVLSTAAAGLAGLFSSTLTFPLDKVWKPI